MFYNSSDDDYQYYDSDAYYGGGDYSSDDSDSDSDSKRVVTKDGRVHSADHADNFRKRLHDAFLSSDYCDVSLVTCSSTVKAHKVVLAANSEYFNAMFSASCAEAINSVVSFKENPFVTSIGLSSILEFAYLGSIQVTLSNVHEILEAARHFLMDDVTKLCERFFEDVSVNDENYAWIFETAKYYGLSNVLERVNSFLMCIKVDIGNYLDILDIAIAGDIDDVQGKVLAFIARQLPYLLCSHDLMDRIGDKALRAMLKADKHGVFTDMTLIKFIAKWVETNPEERLPVLSEVIRCVNLLCFEVEVLDAIANMSFIKDDGRSQEYISEAKNHLTEVKGCSAGDDDLYVITTRGDDIKFHGVAGQPVITCQNLLDIPSRRKGRNMSLAYASSFLTVGEILFIIGRSDNDESCFYSYDPSRRVWKELAPLPVSKSDYKVVYFLGEVYTLGGREGYSQTSRVDIYNISQDKWRIGIPLPQPFRFIRAAVLNNSIYVLGLNDHHQYNVMYDEDRRDLFLKFDPDSQLWDYKNPCPPASNDPYRRNEIGLLLSGRQCLYRCKKDVDATVNARNGLVVQRYDPNRNDWENCTVYIPFEFFDLKNAFSQMDKIYIAVGYSTRNETGRLESEGTSIFTFNDTAEKSVVLSKQGRLQIKGEVNTIAALVNIPKSSISWFARK